MLALIWTFRLLFMDVTYKQVRTSIAERTSREVENIVKANNNVQFKMNKLASSTDTTVILLDGKGQQCIMASSEYGGYVLTSTELSEAREDALKSPDGEYSREITLNSNIDDDRQTKVLIYSRNVIVPGALDGIGTINEGVGTIILTCRILPITSTVQTINLELIIVTFVIIIIAFIVAILLAKYVSRPIIDMNLKSARLAHGDYSVRFSEDGYKEVSELGKTLNYATTELGKTDRMRRDLIANVSHDLRTPLTMIRGYAEMMRDIPNENNADNMNIIINETQYLTNLVKDMLDLSKIDGDIVKMNREIFDMDALLGEVCFRYNAMYKKEGYKFEYEPAQEIYLVESDRIMLTNVLYNLINNAINHIGDDNTVIIRLDDNEDSLRVHIIDHGEGIEESKIDHIWDRYYKMERNLKREVAGSGLGLSIVKSILTKLNSGFGVNSKPGEGSDFYFDIRIKEKIGREDSEADNA